MGATTASTACDFLSRLPTELHQAAFLLLDDPVALHRLRAVSRAWRSIILASCLDSLPFARASLSRLAALLGDVYRFRLPWRHLHPSYRAAFLSLNNLSEDAIDRIYGGSLWSSCSPPDRVSQSARNVTVAIRVNLAIARSALKDRTTRIDDGEFEVGPFRWASCIGRPAARWTHAESLLIESLCESLYIALRKGATNAILFLLNDTNAAELADKPHVLALAASHGNIDTVRLLLSSGFDPLLPARGLSDPTTTTTGLAAAEALRAAAINGHLNVVRLLADRIHGGDLSALGRPARALVRAASGGHADVVRVLLADERVRGGDVTVALMSAVRCGHEGVMRLFVRFGLIEDCELEAASVDAFFD
ncbi:hypothetical protein DFJ73DRAFT_796946 [Zopfochytrium polystomum]|nr:hypothetical protein DFJ73DRAFT_796946 [Zopfochytrium polystomum]